MKKTNRMAFFGFLAAGVLVLSGCSSPAATGGAETASAGAGADSGPVMGGDLVIARGADADTMDNTSAQFANTSIYPFQQMGESLFKPSPDGQAIEPVLATGYTVSDDGLTYMIPLRKDVMFHNGEPMTAKDVKFSIDQNSKTFETGWGYVNNAIDSVNIVDDHTIEVVLKYQWAPIIAALSMFSNAIVPDNYAGKTAEEFYAAPVLTGPFMWGEWKRGEYLKMVKNPNYWEADKPYLDSVTWTVVPDANTRKLQLQGGQIDIDETPNWSSFNELGDSTGITTYAFPSTKVHFLIPNHEKEPFDDVHVRRAIAFAIDRQALVDAVLFGNGTVATSFMAPGTLFHDENVEGPQYDLVKAKAEIAQSSKPNGFATTLLVPSGDANEATVAQILQDQLKAIGIDVEIVLIDKTSWGASLAPGEFDMTLAAWTMDIPDPDQFTTFALTPDAGANQFFTNYLDPELIALNDQAQKSNDVAERAKLYSQIQKLAGESAFLPAMYNSPISYASTDKVRDFFVNPMGAYQVGNIYKIK
jgi:peptide/nickel transport system substrate-binding protein